MQTSSDRRTPRHARHARHAIVATGVVLASALVLATPAFAHPYVVGGGRVPVQSLATIELDLAHGCGVERPGEGPDTDEVALDVPGWLRIVDVPVPDGWDVTIEETLVLWEAARASEPAPRFALDVVVDGEAGETRHLRVSQRCGDAVERWIGTPDEPAEQPAVRLLLEPSDPDRPAPPLPAPPPQPEPAPGPEDAPVPVPQPTPAPVPAGPSADPAPEAAPEASRAIDGRTVAIATVGGALAFAAAARARSGRRGSQRSSSEP